MRHLLTSLAIIATLAAAGQTADSCLLPTTSAGLFDGDDHVWLTDSDFLNFGQSSFTIHVRFRPTDLSNLVECCGYQTLIAKGAAGGNGDKGFNIDLRGEPDDARVKCRFTTATGVDVILTAPIVQNEWYDLVFVVDWSSESATLFLNGAILDEGSLEGLGDPNTDWYTSVGRFVWDNNDENDNHFFRGEMSWLRIQNEADYQLGQVPCSPRENSLFEMTEFTAEEVAAQVSSTFAIDEVITTLSPCELSVSGDGLPSCISGDGLLGWWPFTGNAIDESGNGYNGLVEGATLTENRYNESESAYLFDGDDHITTAGSPFNDLNSFTISTWFQSDNPSPYSVLVSEWPGGGATFKLDHSTENEFLRFDLVTSDGFYSNTVDFAPQQILEWTHFAAVYDGVEIHIYINGVSTGDAIPASGFVSSTSGVLMIGDEQNNSAPFQGKIDDVTIWARALSAEEVETLHASRFLSFMPILDLGEDIETCEDSVILDAGEGFGSYLWSTGETSQSIVVGESGTYGIEALSITYKAALQFSNSDQIKRFSENPFTSEKEAGSITTWIKLNDFNPAQDGDGSFFINGFNGDTDNIGFGMHTGIPATENKWRFGFYNDSWNWATADSIIELDRWYHLTGTWGTEGIRIYVDGSLEGSSNNSGPSPSCSETVLGGNSNASLMCSILEVAMWEHALDSTEIQALLNCPLENGQDESGLLGYWNFESHNGLDWLDLSPYQNHLTNHAEDPLPQVDQTEFSYECEDACLDSDEILVDFDDCDGYCGEGTVWDNALQECIGAIPPPDSILVPSPSCGEGTVWDPVNEECIIAIPADLNYDGCVTVADLLELLTVHGTCPPMPFSGPCQGQDHVTYQGHDYDIVLIGEQCWFAENLQAESYRNGDEIESGISDADWGSLSGATSVYGEGTSDCESFAPDGDACVEDWPLIQYGRLYNWYAVDDERGLCPFGWHVPSLSHWTDLTAHLDSLGDAGFLMKTSTGWSNNGGGSNDSGFSGLPTGYRNWDGSFYNAGKRGYWWSCTPHPSESDAWAYYLRLVESQNHVDHFHDEAELGFAVRCIKDQ